MPAQSRGPASTAESSSGIRGEAWDRRDHVFGITPVIIDTWHFQHAAMDEVAAAARRAHAAIAAEPADADPLADAPGGHLGADGVDAARDLVTWHDRIGNAGKGAIHRKGIAVTNAAGFDLNAHLAWAGLCHWPVDKLMRRMWLGNLHNAHWRSP